MSDVQSIMNEVKKAIVGKDKVLWWVIIALLAGGNILLEDIPGVGKTTMALAFSKALGLQYGRMQFTPDVLPSDINGFNVYNKETGKMSFQRGAVFCNLFLADELNRATSRTQSALLEAMEEGNVTVDGISYRLPEPFFVIATQNPTGAAGTQLLPDSQLDRFAIRETIGYPSPKAERTMVLNRQKRGALDTVTQVCDAKSLVRMQREAMSVYIKPEIVDGIIKLISATRNNPCIVRGASPRATLDVTDMAKALAYVQGRDYVIPEDVRSVFCDTVEHRVIFSPEVEGKAGAGREILEQILTAVKMPKLVE